MESLNEIYRELAELIGIDKTIKIYNNYKGLQVNFPTRLYDREYIINQAIEASKNGKSTRDLAVQYGYSERWIRKMILENEKSNENQKGENK